MTLHTWSCRYACAPTEEENALKVIVKRKEPQSKQVPISTEFIRLEALLKLADAGKKAKARGYRLLPGRHLCGNSP